MDAMDAFIRDDRMIEHFGMQVEAVEDGYVRVAATVREDFLNSHGVAHGALIFAIIDVAFAIVVNAVVDAMGVQWSFNILRAAKPGDRVIGECRLIHRGSRLQVVEYEARDQAGALLAKGQATAMSVKSGAADSQRRRASEG